MGFKIHLHSVFPKLTTFPLKVVLRSGDFCEHRPWETLLSISQNLVYLSPMQTSISGPILRCVLFHRSNPLTNSHILEQPSSALSCPGWALRPSTHPLGHSHLLQHTLSISPSRLISEPFLTSTEKADALFPTFLRPQEPWHCQWVLICSTRLHRHLCSVVLLSRLNIFLLSHQSSRGRSSETSPH